MTDTSPPPLVLPEGFADHIYDELVTLEVQLDSDPLIYGPKRLNAKVALTRKCLSRCERIFLDVSQRLAAFKRAFRRDALLLDLEKKHLLANDPEVRAGRAVSEREALVTGKVLSMIRQVFDAEDGIADLESVLSVVKAKRSDLRDTQARLRDQMRLCQEETSLGNRWGSQSPRAVALQPNLGVAVGADASAVDSLLLGVQDIVGQETHLPAEVDPLGDFLNTEEADLMSAGVPGALPPITDFPLNGLLCDVCDQPQHVTRHGDVCVNGHGGAPGHEPELAEEASEEVAPVAEEEEVEDSYPEVEEVAAVVALPGTSSMDDVDAFLAIAPDVSAKKRNRRLIEEEVDFTELLKTFS